jgi:hypothetical protein
VETRIDLSGGGWAVLKSPKDLKAKDKIAVQRTIAWEQEASDDDEPGVKKRQVIPVNAGLSDDLQMAMLGRVITSWSIDGTTPAPVPATAELLGDLSVDDYDTLTEAITDHMQLLRSRPNRTTPTA